MILATNIRTAYQSIHSEQGPLASMLELTAHLTRTSYSLAQCFETCLMKPVIVKAHPLLVQDMAWPHSIY